MNNKSALIEVLAWRQKGDKPLPEPMVTQSTDPIMRHQCPLLLTWINFNPSKDK